MKHQTLLNSRVQSGDPRVTQGKRVPATLIFVPEDSHAVQPQRLISFEKGSCIPKKQTIGVILALDIIKNHAHS